jgi:hypothetical protein
VAPLALRAISGWTDAMAGEWVATYARRVGREQRWCRGVARMLRMPSVVSPVVALLEHWPALAQPALAHLRPRATRT